MRSFSSHWRHYAKILASLFLVHLVYGTTNCTVIATAKRSEYDLNSVAFNNSEHNCKFVTCVAEVIDTLN